MPAIAVRLLEAVPGLTILHQSGARHAEVTEAAYRATGADPNRWKVYAFLDDMGRRFEAADLVLARSGASTVAELSAAGKPALLVPFPLAADDHQRRNAEVMRAAGAAEVLLEKELTPEHLLAMLTGLLADADRLAAMGAKARLLARPDAAERISSMAQRIARK
jgi:UDP-N-acetylglucosamine--N-acetylmuramyl-(pentapeptide) pyrophosphoryl-undecaprenol N-acetylglucosamine transferase